MTAYPRSGHVTDEATGTPIPGASVYVYNLDGTDAAITSDGTSPLTLPLTTDQFGNYSYYAIAGYYDEVTWFAGKQRFRENNIALGNPGADLNLRSDLSQTTGAALVGTTGAGTVQGDISARPTSATLAAAGGAGLVGFDRSTGYVGGSVGGRLKREVYITDAPYNAAQGGADITTALTNAIAAGASRIIIPSLRSGGSYTVSGTIAVPSGCEIVGQGRWETNIVQTALDHPIFSMDGVAHASVGHLSLGYSGTPLSSSGLIYCNNSQECDFEFLRLTSSYIGIGIYGGGNNNVLNCRSSLFLQSSILLSSAVNATVNNVLNDAGNSTNGSLGAVRLVGPTEGCLITGVRAQLGLYGLTTANTGSAVRGQAPWGNHFSGNFWDSNKTNAALIDSLLESDFTGDWFASSGHDFAVGYTSAGDSVGILLSNSADVSFTGGAIKNCGGHGAFVAASNARVSFGGGMRVNHNGYSRTASRAGIQIAAGTTDFSAQNLVGFKDDDTTTYRQTDLVNVAAGASDRYLISDNLLGGCTVTDSGTGTNKRVANNY